jgi:hypothetical protein
MMAQMSGKVSPSIVIVRKVGKPRFWANHIPRYAPINPRIVETKQPPIEYPAIAWPRLPAIAAMTNNMRKPSNDPTAKTTGRNQSCFIPPQKRGFSL